METAIVPAIYDPSLADEDLRVGTEEAHTHGAAARARRGPAGRASRRARRWRRRSQVARRLDEGVVVTVFPDGAEKYLTETFWTADE